MRITLTGVRLLSLAHSPLFRLGRRSVKGLEGFE